jgi:PAS domain S-box-containing protein
MSLPAGLATALNAVTEILGQRLRQLGQGEPTLDEKAHAEDLAVALEELNVVSEELNSQLRNVDEERERSAYFFDAAPYPFVITDTSGHVTDANRAAVAFLGVLPHRLAGKPLIAFIAPNQRAALREKLTALLEKKEDAWSECDLVVTPREGDHVPSRAHVRVMPYGSRGASIFWILRARDT